jgi:hypothetical protein
MSINQKIIKKFILYFIVFAFAINIINLVNTEIYNYSEVKEYNQDLAVNSGIIGEKNFCLTLKQPLGGMVIYRELFSLSWLAIELSAAFVFLGFILTLSEKRMLPKEYRFKLALFLPIIFLSWAILLYSWMSVEPWFYNCAKFFHLL